MIQVTLDNFKQYIGKNIDIQIYCYEAGFIVPENNILLGMNEEYFYFLSDKDTEYESYWHFKTKSDKKLSIDVFVINPPIP